MTDLIDTASPAQLRALCRWFWRFLVGPLGKYVDEAAWVRAANKVIGGNQ